MMSNFNPTPLAHGVRCALFGSGAVVALLAPPPLHASPTPDHPNRGVSASGYVKFDAIYDADADLGDSLDATAVPVGDDETDDGTVRFHAKQSRFRLAFHDDEIMVKGRIEVDFFTGDGNEVVSNSRHLRLRHAFFTVHNWTFGQTWSTFMDRDAIATGTTVDFGGPAGVTFNRQAMIRYTNGDFDIALENPEARIGDGTLDADGEANTSAGKDSFPDLIARYASTADGLSWYVSGLLANYEADGGPADGEAATNVGVQGGIDMGIGGGNSVFGNAIVNGGRYTYYGFAQPAAVVDGDDLETVDHIGASVGINLDWGSDNDAKTTIVYGVTQFDDEHEDLIGGAETISTLHANYRWTPYKRVDFGVEISVAGREDFDGDDGDNTRLQLGARYAF